VVAGNMVRCGLFAASTYSKALPDAVMADYLQYCQNDGQVDFQPTRALDFAHKVVAAAPDFSWGWSAVANASMFVALGDPTSADSKAQRAEGLEAANKALKLDPTNSEALGDKSLMLPPSDLTGRERLIKRALAARPQSCGCEHYIYGNLLREVGRLDDATGQIRRGTELNPLDGILQWGLADTLLATGRTAEAKPHLDLSRDLAQDADFAASIVFAEALLTGDLSGTLTILRDPRYSLPKGENEAFIAGFEALQSHDPAAKARAIQLLTNTKFGPDGVVGSNLLAALGANGAALKIVSNEAAAQTWNARTWLFYPTMARALRDPSFPALAQRLGLIRYWKTSHTKPDVCVAKDPPPFCRMI
jgi:tetratricopeptide (TPR) repeat protein